MFTANRDVQPEDYLPDGRYNHVQQVQDRLRFLRFLLKVSRAAYCPHLELEPFESLITVADGLEGIINLTDAEHHPELQLLLLHEISANSSLSRSSAQLFSIWLTTLTSLNPGLRPWAWLLVCS